MADSFLERLNRGDLLVSDGATGTNLTRAGLPPGTPAEGWVLDHPEHIQHLHRAFIEAGSDLILTCTFSGNRLALERSGYADRVTDINRTAARLARATAEESEREIFVGGSIGPTGHMMAPLGTLTHADAVNIFSEQGAALAEGGVDFIVLETFYALEEAQAALEGVKQVTDLPLIVSFSYDRKGRTMMGVRPEQMAKVFSNLGVHALGANCGSSLEEMASVLQALITADTDLPLWIKPNAGVPVGNPPRHQVTPQEMGVFAGQCVKAGAQILGGCCGNSPEHVKAIAEAVKKT